jgi:hypothetical protein
MLYEGYSSFLITVIQIQTQLRHSKPFLRHMGVLFNEITTAEVNMVLRQ